MNLNGFLGGCFGIVGFAVSVLAGLHADNGFGTVIFHAVLCMIGCYVVGYIIGWAAQVVAREHAADLADKVAKRDEAERQKKEEALADADVATA